MRTLANRNAGPGSINEETVGSGQWPGVQYRKYSSFKLTVCCWNAAQYTVNNVRLGDRMGQEPRVCKNSDREWQALMCYRGFVGAVGNQQRPVLTGEGHNQNG